MKLKFKDWPTYHHQIYRIYHGVIAISLVPFFLAFLELEVASVKEAKISNVWVIITLILLLPFCIFINWQVWKSSKFTYKLADLKKLKDKLIEFRRVEIKKYLWMELVGVLALLGLWLTAHYLFVIMYFALLAQFSFLRPSEDRVIRNLRLTKEERKQLHEASF